MIATTLRSFSVLKSLIFSVNSRFIACVTWTVGDSTTGEADAGAPLGNPVVPDVFVFVVEAVVVEVNTVDGNVDVAAAVAAAAAAAMEAFREVAVELLDEGVAGAALARWLAAVVTLDDALGREVEEDALEEDADDLLDDGAEEGWCKTVP